MKKTFTILIAAIAAILMMAQPTKVVGQTRTDEVYKTLTFKTSSNGSTIQDYTSSWTETVSSFSWTIANFNTNKWGWTDGGSPALYVVKCGRKQKNNSNVPSVATITTNAAIDKAITKVVVSLTAISASDYNSIKLYVASNAAFSENLTTINVSPIPTSSGDMTITVPEANRAANRYYKLEFDTKGSTTSNGHTGVKKVEYYKASEAPAYTITALSNNTNYGTVSLNGSVITGAPVSGYRYASPAYSVSPANSATVSQDGNAFTVAPTANTTVTINFEAIPQYSVTFSVNGTTSSQNYYEGATITFPDNPENIYGKTFVGWTTTAIEGTTNTAPTFVNTSETITCTAAITYYAVFADMTGSASPTLTKMTSGDTFAANDKVVIVADGDVAMYQETTNTTYVNKWSFDNNAATVAADNKKWLTVSSGSTTGTWKLGDATNGYVYNSSSNDLKIDTENSTDFTLAWNGTVNQVEINKFTLIGNSRWLSYRSDLGNKYYRMGGQTSGNASGTIYFDIYKYSTGSVSYINYCTTVSEPAVEIPEIAIAENPFLFSTTVTITCGTEGSSIKYRYNENDSWSDYTAALTITETKTIYAKGVKGDDESTVAQATATKNLANPTVTVSGDLIVDLDGETNVNAGTLSAAVTYNDETVAGATVTWGSNHPEIATIDASTGAVTLLATGEVTFTATYAGNGDYSGASGTKTVTVVNSKAPGTEGNPYTVAQALTIINALSDNGTLDDKYVRGIISSVGSYNSTYSSITYWISDDGTDSSELQVYSGKGIGGAAFTAATDLKVDDVVVVSGTLKKYVKNSTTTPEFDKNSAIESLIRPGTGSNPATIAGTVVDFTIANDENYIVASNTTLTVNGTLTNNGTAANLIIEDGGQLILANGNTNVNATIKKALPEAAALSKNEAWTTIASPVRNIGIGTYNTEEPCYVTNLKNADYALYRLNEATTSNQWENYKNTSEHSDFTTLETGRGYLYSRASLATLEYVGIVDGNAFESYNLSITTGNDSRGFHLIGNPYSHDIYKGAAGNGYAIPNTQQESYTNNDYELATGFYRLKNGTTWETHIDAGTKIESGEGILVQATSAGVLRIYNSNTINPAPEPSKADKANRDNIMFTVANDQYEDVTYALFDKGIGLNKINHRDANVPMLYIPQNGKNFAIAIMSDDTQTFGLNFKTSTTGKYTLSLKTNGNFSYLHVIDRMTGEDVDMLLEGEYSFVGSSSDNENRFIVRLSYLPDYGEEFGIFAYQSGSDIYVSGEGELQIFDVTGRFIMSEHINGATSINADALSNGVYVLRIVGSEIKTQKIVIR